jgi:hypothetical protein
LPDANDNLGTHRINANTSVLNATIAFTKDEANYELIFDLLVHSKYYADEVVDPEIG